MSLRDTIEAARREAQEGGSLRFGKDADEPKEEEAAAAAGFSRRSTAKAKPTREAAASVRVVSADDAKAGRSGKKPAEMTKEERKAERARQRDEEDLRNMAANILLKRDEPYAKTQRIWWIALIAGMIFTAISFGLNYLIGKNEAYATVGITLVSIGSLVLAYACIIGAFVYDFIKGRPIRRRVDDEVRGMTKKRLEALVREDAEAEEAK